MSQYMQIDIRVIPFYEKPFVERFPNLADILRRFLGIDSREKESSIYALVDELESVIRNPKTPSDLKDKMGPFVHEMVRVKKMARETLLARKLNELDRLLYRLEDQFEDLESSL